MFRVDTDSDDYLPNTQSWRHRCADQFGDRCLPERSGRLPNAGTYNLTAPITLTKSNVTLRGAGPSLTKLVFSTYSGYAYIEMGGSGSFTPSPITNWTAGYAQGGTSITVASASGFAVGDLVALDQT